MSVEHGHVDVTGSARKFSVGESLTFIPQHGGMTTNLHDCMHVVCDGEGLDVWPLAARGRAQ